MNIFVEHIAIVAKDPVTLKNWYERVLGAREVFNNGENPPACLLARGNVWFEIYAAEEALPETANNKLAGFRHLALRVDSLAAAKAELEKRGVKFTAPERPPAAAAEFYFLRIAKEICYTSSSDLKIRRWQNFSALPFSHAPARAELTSGAALG